MQFTSSAKVTKTKEKGGKGEGKGKREGRGAVEGKEKWEMREKVEGRNRDDGEKDRVSGKEREKDKDKDKEGDGDNDSDGIENRDDRDKDGKEKRGSTNINTYTPALSRAERGPVRVDHMCIDMNQILHASFRSSADPSHCMAKVTHTKMR